jgi:hypothetical protein
MSSAEISQFIDNYVRKNLSPKSEQRDYITKKYSELCGFLGNDCFQSGSYARFTAIDPVHDLDVIYVLPDNTVLSNPQKVMAELRTMLLEVYKGSKISKIKEIVAQTHSVTIVFDDEDEPESFSIDVVPAVTSDSETNEFSDSLYIVPEILKANHKKRVERYKNEAKNPIGWIKSDPKGYISAATKLDADTNGTFRKAVKVVKSWRHKQKKDHEDDFMLKSFHLELICVEFFESNPIANTLEAIAGCVALLAERLDQSHYPDRADSTQYVDQYIEDKLTDEGRELILRLQQEAAGMITELSSASSVTEVATLLDKLTSTDTVTTTTTTPAFTQRVVVPTPSQPWGY